MSKKRKRGVKLKKTEMKKKKERRKEKNKKLEKMRNLMLHDTQMASGFSSVIG